MSKLEQQSADQPKRRLLSWLRAIFIYALWIAVTFATSQLLVAGLLGAAVYLGVDLSAYLNDNLLVIGLGVVIYLLMLLMTVGVPRWLLRQATTRHELGIQKPLNWLDIALAAAGMVTYFVLTGVLMLVASEILPWFNLEQSQDIGIVAPQAGLELMLAFLLLVAIGPLVEELLFRGYLYGKIRSRGVPFWLTTLVVSVLFGVAHLQWNVGVDTFALSLVMCATREITGTVWASVLMHMAKNGIAFYFLFVNPQLLQGLTG